MLNLLLTAVPKDVADFGEVVAEFVESEPVAAAVVSAVVLGLALLLARKVFNVALVVVAIVAVLGGLAVFLVGPDQATDYLEELRENSAEIMESMSG